MKKLILLCGLSFSLTTVFAQNGFKTRPTTANYSQHQTTISRTAATTNPHSPVNTAATKSVSCTDEVQFATNGGANGADDFIFVGGTGGWESMMQTYPDFTGQVTSFRFEAKSLTGSPVTVQASIHALGTSDEPQGGALGAANVQVAQNQGMVTATFSSPVNVTNGFAVAIWAPSSLTDSIQVYITANGTGANTGTSWLYHNSVGVLSLLLDYGADLNVIAMPTISFSHPDPTLAASGSTTACEGSSVNTTLTGGTALAHYSSIIFNPDGIDYEVNYGDGTAPATGTSSSHTYNLSGTFQAQGSATYVGWNNECTSTSNQIAFNIESLPTSFFSFDATGLSVEFNSLSTGATTYSWNFGDGGTASSPSPIHNYTTGGTYTVELTVTGPCGTDLYFKNITIATGQNGGDVGVEENDGMHFNIYPNPANNYVLLSYAFEKATDFSADLISADGRIITTTSSQATAEGTMSIDLSGLNAGVYFLSMHIDGKNVVRQIIKN